MASPDPLTVTCPYCQEPPGNRCGTVSAYSRMPHKARVRLALAMAAHADPALPGQGLGPMSACLLCGSGLPQRHRIVDAIAGHLEAGEFPEEIADELSVPAAAVVSVREWMRRWPGAWG
jgi:hypothetical protein